MCKSGVVYKYKCDSCNAVYIGHTGLQLHVRIHKHMGLSYRTGLPILHPEHSNIRDHSSTSGHHISIQSFSILKTLQNDVKRKIVESLYIRSLSPELNLQSSSLNINIL